MARRNDRRPRPPLDEHGLDELALAYVGRFATTRARLCAYLARKVRERGWAGDAPVRIETVVERLCGLGYVDDRAFALSKARSLTARGYGERRVGQALRAAGIEEEDSVEARQQAGAAAVESAIRFARKRQIGPFAGVEADGKGRERAIAAMVRAGHDFAIAREIVDLPPGSGTDELLAREG